MNCKDFNLLEAIEQITKREQANLSTIDAIQSASAEPLMEFDELRQRSEQVLEAITEIAEIAKGETS